MLSGKHAYQAHKLTFYTAGLLGAVPPRGLFRRRRRALLAAFDALPAAEQEAIMARVAYYNRLDASTPLGEGATCNRTFALRAQKSTYHLDFYRIAKYFSPKAAYHYRFGDKTCVPEVPTFVKSRPIHGNNANSVLLKLDSVRHFYTVKDTQSYADKKDALVWRGAAHQPHRRRFLEQCYGAPRCDIGATDSKSETAPYQRPFMPIEQQLEHKFIFSIEGNDVATNLKWIMASNSLCFMKRPIFETWFMEGALVPGYHYVEVKDDFSDLEAQIDYYLTHPEKARAIIRNANRYIAEFFRPRHERLIALKVFERYLRRTEQAI
ncbi:glycosyl transferase family 90 [Halomonas cibimaris]|uniref:Glycosyl transferase family 90 n=1 Tax=Halomonas cibimaris TaxID=657012 RepID=A0ABP7LMM4_9GAMM